LSDTSEQDPQIRKWIAEIKSGESWDESSQGIHLTFAPWVVAFFRNRGCGAQDAEDLTQDVFLQVFSKLPDYSEDGSFRSWLFAIVVNTWKNWIQFNRRKIRNAPVVSIDSGRDQVPVDPPAREVSVETALLTLEDERLRRRQLRQAIAQLPERMRRCTKLHIFDGFRSQEIAVLMRISPKTVRVQIHNAKKKLIELLREKNNRAFG